MLDNQIRDVLQPYTFITLAILFGSMANDSEQFYSDLDLAVQGERPLTQDEKMQLIEV